MDVSASELHSQHASSTRVYIKQAFIRRLENLYTQTIIVSQRKNSNVRHKLPLLFQASNTAFAAVTLSALYQMAADDGLCNSPYFLQRHPMRKQAYEKI